MTPRINYQYVVASMDRPWYKPENDIKPNDRQQALLVAYSLRFSSNVNGTLLFIDCKSVLSIIRIGVVTIW